MNKVVLMGRLTRDPNVRRKSTCYYKIHISCESYI